MDSSIAKQNRKIEQLGALMLKSKHQSNALVDLFRFASSAKKSVCAKAISQLQLVFTGYLANRRFKLISDEQQRLNEANMSMLNADEKYALWMNQRYRDFKQLLQERLLAQRSDLPVKIACLNAQFSLIKQETNLSTNATSSADSESETVVEKKSRFPLEMLEVTIEALLTRELDEKLLKKLRVYLAYADVRYFMLKSILVTFFANHKKLDETSIGNLIDLFSVMPGLVKDKKPTKKPIATADLDPANKTTELSDAEIAEALGNEEAEEDPAVSQKSAAAAGNDENQAAMMHLFALKKENLTDSSKICQIDMHRKLFNDCFVHLLKQQLSAKLYKKLLVKLPEKILPKMSNPLMLADFLTQSYNSGGLISVLALNSLFLLINNYNLTKYKDRFFQLLDMFLTSTHLASTLVAAFIKKLSRMSLACPPADLRFLVLFVFNLLIRHKNCKILIHNQRNSNNVSKDPFDVNCLDFAKCNALSSSLWELQSLKHHYSSSVSKEVEKLTNLNINTEYMLDEAFEENSYEALIAHELDANKATANCAISYLLSSETPNTSGVTKSVAADHCYDRSVSTILKIN